MQRMRRGWHRALSTGLIVLLVAVSVLPIATHAQLFDDPYCDQHPGAAAGSHGDAPANQVRHIGGAASVADPAQHCDVCHWLRSMRVFDPQPAAVLAPMTDAAVAAAELVSQPDVEYAVALAARAPPA